jgi:hypothetical protein
MAFHGVVLWHPPTHTHTHTHLHPHPHAHTLSLTRPLTHSHTHSYTLTHPPTHSLTHADGEGVSTQRHPRTNDRVRWVQDCMIRSPRLPKKTGGGGDPERSTGRLARDVTIRILGCGMVNQFFQITISNTPLLLTAALAVSAICARLKFARDLPY